METNIALKIFNQRSGLSENEGTVKRIEKSLRFSFSFVSIRDINGRKTHFIFTQFGSVLTYLKLCS